MIKRAAAVLALVMTLFLSARTGGAWEYSSCYTCRPWQGVNACQPASLPQWGAQYCSPWWDVFGEWHCNMFLSCTTHLTDDEEEQLADFGEEGS